MRENTETNDKSLASVYRCTRMVLSMTIVFFFQLEDNCFTMLCWFLLHNTVNQL